jgi:hypothetical protein
MGPMTGVEIVDRIGAENVKLEKDCPHRTQPGVEHVGLRRV